MIVLYLIMRFTSLIPITTGEIIVLYTFIPMFMASFKNVYSLVMAYHVSRPYLKSMGEFLNLPAEDTGTVALEKFEKLETKNLSLENRGKTVRIPDVTIAGGDKVLIRGESGIGKSTLFNILLGLRKDYAGSVKVNGHELRDINIESLRKIVGISFKAPASSQ